jgi:prolyl-tRNA editing enzyme YbaK/EbsC (Cys-tRNA(Pro) deacylase)
MSEPLKASAQRVQAALDASGIPLQVREFPASTKTSQEAAAAVGCEVAQIAKSMIFRAAGSDRPVLVMASGANRVDEKKLALLLGEKVERASADFVRSRTGFAIGGVPPVGHLEAPAVLIDEDLMALEVLWAAAGTPNAVFRLTPAELKQLTGGRVAAIKQG